jgi:hypothetical protein
MQISKQLAIFLDNRPGMLARVADALAEAKINIYAITTSDYGGPQRYSHGGE